MDDTDIVDIEHIAPLEADHIPDSNQSHFCFSCEEPIVGQYCAACGQKNDNFRRSILSLIKEFLASITAIEGRIWRTWGTLLFNPGKVAREFADGRRSKWSSPVRVYLAMSILLFGYIGITNTQILSIDVNVRQKPGMAKTLEETSPLDLIMTGSMNMFATQGQIDKRNADRNFDLIDIILKEGTKYELDLTEDGLTFIEKNSESNDTDKEDTFPSNPIKAMQKGFIEGTKDKDGQNIDTDEHKAHEVKPSGPWMKVNGKDVTGDTGRQAFQSFLKNPTRFNDTFSKWLPRVMFFMMPFTMLLGFLFIRGRGNALLYDHLVHSAYVHAVAFFVLLVGLILGLIPWLSGGWISLLLFGYLFLYLPLSLKKMFKRGPLKTVWTSYSIGFIYLITMLIVLLLLVVLGIKDFVDPLNL